MNHDQLKIDLQSPSVVLIRSENAALILSFFHEEFKREPLATVSLDDFTEHLDRYLDRLREQHPHLYPDKAKNYIRQWSEEKGWLRIYRPGSSTDYVVELTTHAQHALRWANDLQEREFVGTESRFSQILSLLNEIVVKSNTSAEDRIHQLETEKMRLEEQIERIRATGEVEQFTPLQIRERFQLATEQAAQLLQDFTAVEERFREIARLVQQEQIKPHVRKGLVVGKVLDADEQLRESEIGRSFYAFWDYLQQPARREALYRLLGGVFSLEALAGPAKDKSRLRDMPRYLIDAGLKVDQSNQRLAEQLRRMLDETNVTESRRIRALIGEVKQLIAEHPELLDEKITFLTIETLPQAQLVMERELWSPKEAAALNLLPLEEASSELAYEAFAALVDVFYVDESKIRERIERALDGQSEIPLTQLLQQHPVTKGLPEVMAYIQFATQNDDQHEIDSEHRDHITVPATVGNHDPFLKLDLPRVTFRRANRG